MPQQPRRARAYGNDLYREIELPASPEPFRVTYWDLWMLVVLAGEFGNDWDKMVEHFRHELGASYSFRHYEVEGLLNHLRMLRQALAQVGLTAQDVLGEDEAGLLKRERRQARRRILEKSLPDREKSHWMIHTPRVQGEARAMRGYWSRFPVSLKPYARQIEGVYKTSGYYSENQSWGLESKLSKVLDRGERDASPDELLALYRAFLTVVVEKMDIVDDSYGVIGQLYGQVFQAYVGLPCSELSIAASDFFQDLNC